MISKDDPLLTPREVAEMFGVSVATISVWARAGTLPFTPTPGGHRRYHRSVIQEIIEKNAANNPIPEEERQREEDLVRLYNQGWSIRRVAELFGFSYGKTRRIIKRHSVLRPPGAGTEIR